MLGTRGSELARAQTSLVEAALRGAHPEMEIAIEVITTKGDENLGVQPASVAGRKGLFTAEIERALLERGIDVAVHSAKDLPSEATSGSEIGATLPRAQVEDVLIARTAPSLGGLPLGATVATGSVRRRHQVRWSRPDLNIVDLRGNVPTRLRKLSATPWDAIMLARAGLERLGYDCTRGEIVFEGQTLRTAMLDTDQFLPAGGQGIVALQIRSDDAETRRIITELNHPETYSCLRAEREFLRRLEGDCGTPVGVLATIEDEWMNLRAQVFVDSQSEPNLGKIRARITEQQPEALAASLFQSMYGEKK